jgi:hypothetical protein
MAARPPILASRPPAPIAAAVALVAGAMLLVELMATRIFSVLFFYHFSFFAVSLVMTGLALGGILVAPWRVREWDEAAFRQRLSWLATVFAAATLGAVFVISAAPPLGDRLSAGQVAVHAVVLLPGLVAAGGFLALAFARNERWIGRLYAADLLAASAACLLAIAVMRTLGGPPMLLAPVALAALGAGVLATARWSRRAALLALALALGCLGTHLARPAFLRLATPRPPAFEAWNEHSRVVAYGGPHRPSKMILIDRTAVTFMHRTRLGPDGLAEIDPAWGRAPNEIAYRLGRPLERVAIIGVGGGDDLRAPLAGGAERIDGYELNGILVDLLEDRFRDYNALAGRPEVDLVHGEARVGLAHSDARYDVIQASLIDTWAATADGGFVLSESGLYTLEGWQVFLSSLSPRGVLTMTRWLLPGAPAETHRLVALAAEALARDGIADARRHVFLIGHRVGRMRDAFDPQAPVFQSTILVSRRPFTASEVERLERIADEVKAQVLLSPGRPAADPVLARLLDPATRARAITGSPWDISPPTDARPYFFLQLRPRDVLDLAGRDFGTVTEITFNGIRVLLILAVLSAGFALAVLVLTLFTLPAAEASPGERRTYRRMALYFLGIGLGYILLQLGLHQRLILVLGHPTTALSVVLFWMLVGTGLGSFASERWVADARMPRAWAAILAIAGLLWAGYPLLAEIGRLDSGLLRAAATGAVLAVTGFALGFGFPLGVRLVGPTGQRAVQRMWAINGAASIAGTALAAALGVTAGSRGVLAAGALAYLLAVAAGWWAWRGRDAGAP